MSLVPVIEVALGVTILCLALAFFARSGRLMLAPIPVLVYFAAEVRLAWWAPLAHDFSHAPQTAYASYTFVGLLATLVGYFLVCTTSRGRLRGGDVAHYLDRGVDIGAGTAEALLRGSMVLVGVLVAIGLALHGGLPPLGSILDVITGNAESGLAADLSAMREELTKSHLFGGKWRGQGALSTIQSWGWLVATVIPMAIYAGTRRKTARNLAILSLIMGMLSIAGLGKRASVVSLLILVIISAGLLWRPRAPTIIATAALVGGILLALVPLGQANEPLGLLERQSTLVGRIFAGNGNNNVRIMQWTEEGRLRRGDGSLHLQKLEALMPGGRGEDVFAWQLNQLRGEKVSETAFASPTNTGFVFADFGLLGLLAISLGIGGGLAMMENSMFRRGASKTPIAVAGRAVAIGAVFQLPGATLIACLVVGVLGGGLLLFLHVISGLRNDEGRRRGFRPAVSAG